MVDEVRGLKRSQQDLGNQLQECKRVCAENISNSSLVNEYPQREQHAIASDSRYSVGPMNSSSSSFSTPSLINTNAQALTASRGSGDDGYALGMFLRGQLQEQRLFTMEEEVKSKTREIFLLKQEENLQSFLRFRHHH